MTDNEAMNNIIELTDMNDELTEEIHFLKDELMVMQSIIIDYQRKHIAELQEPSGELCMCDGCLH